MIDYIELGTLTVTAISVCLIFVQIKLSNKHKLFEKRLYYYNKINKLIKLYEDNKDFLNVEKNKESLLEAQDIFLWLTNCTFLEECSVAIKTPLEQPIHKCFLIKLEELEQLAREIKFIFYDNISRYFSEFIIAYGQVLYKIYQYEILLNNMRKYSVQFKINIDEVLKKFKALEKKEELLDTYETLNIAYSKIKDNNLMIKMKKQITLFRKRCLTKC